MENVLYVCLIVNNANLSTDVDCMLFLSLVKYSAKENMPIYYNLAVILVALSLSNIRLCIRFSELITAESAEKHPFNQSTQSSIIVKYE